MFLFVSESDAELLRLDQAAAALVDRPGPCDLLTGDKSDSSSLEAFLSALQSARLEILSAILRGHLSYGNGQIRRAELERWKAGRVRLIPQQPAPPSITGFNEPLVLCEHEISEAPATDPIEPLGRTIDLTDRKQREAVKRLVLAILDELDAQGRRYTQKEVGRHPALDVYREAYLTGVPDERREQREKSFVRAFVAPLCQLRKPPSEPKRRKPSRSSA